MGFSSRNGRRVLTSVLAEARGPGTPGAFVTIVVCSEGRLFPDTMENAGPFIGQRIGGQAIVLARIVFMSIDCFICDTVQHVSDTFIHFVSVHY